MQKWLTLFKKYQKILVHSAIILVSIILFVGVILPTAVKIKGLLAEIVDSRNTLEAAQAKLTTLQGLDENALKSNLATLLAAIPQDKAIPSLITTVDNLAAQTGVSLGNLSFTGGEMATESSKKSPAKEKGSGIQALRFNLALAGDLPGIINFLTTSTRVRRLLKINTFSLSLEFTAGSRAVMNAETFYAPIAGGQKAAAKLSILTGEEETLLSKLGNYPDLGQISFLAEPLANEANANLKSDPFAP